MYVARLDRPWLETPFLLEGFLIREEKEAAEIAQHCEYVYIDIERGDDVQVAPSRQAKSPPRPAPAPPAEDPNDSTQTEIELPRARREVENIAGEITNAFESARETGIAGIGSMKVAVRGLVKSVIRSSDAALLLARLRRKDDYTYNHAISTSILSVALGKQVNFDQEELEELALAASLFDIGKVKVPDGLLAKTDPLSRAELKVLRSHVDYSIEILTASGANSTVIEIARDHHERCDGSGYPAGKQRNEIGMFAQIVGLTDAYDAMISRRVYRAAMSHEAAVRELYELRDIHFQAEILEQLIQVLGTYPAGSLVELTTGEVGVVTQQNRLRRLRPQVMLVLDEDKQPLDHFPVINLLQESANADGRPLAIATSLSPGAYGIDPAEYFL
ncbi:MAG: DUF3391 domain-containing protein [Gammaproteobacteria bacterium]|nr:DUF3391 domain-containing protein [Gammaproteobacteria bacterium]